MSPALEVSDDWGEDNKERLECPVPGELAPTTQSFTPFLEVKALAELYKSHGGLRVEAQKQFSSSKSPRSSQL